MYPRIKYDKGGKPIANPPTNSESRTNSGDHNYAANYWFGCEQSWSRHPANQTWVYEHQTTSLPDRGQYCAVRSNYTGSLPSYKSQLPGFGLSAVNQPNWPEKKQNLGKIVRQKWRTESGGKEAFTSETSTQTEDFLLNDYLSGYLDIAIRAYEDEKLKISNNSSKDYKELDTIAKTNGIHPKHIGNLAPTPIEPKLKVVPAKEPPKPPTVSNRKKKNALQKRNFPSLEAAQTTTKAEKIKVVSPYPSMGVVYTPNGKVELPQLLTPFRTDKSYKDVVGDSGKGTKITTIVPKPEKQQPEKVVRDPRSVKAFLKEYYPGRKQFLDKEDRKEISLFSLLRDSAPKSWADYEDCLQQWNGDIFQANNYWEINNRLTKTWFASDRLCHRQESKKWSERQPGTKIISHGPVEPDFSRLFYNTTKPRKQHVKENGTPEKSALFKLEEPVEPVSPVFWRTEMGEREEFSTPVVESSQHNQWRIVIIMILFMFTILLMHVFVNNLAHSAGAIVPLMAMIGYCIYKVMRVGVLVKDFFSRMVRKIFKSLIPTEDELFEQLQKRQALKKANEISVSGILSEIQSRPLGITAQAYQMSKAKDRVELTTSTISMLSLCGIEEKLIGKSIGYFSQKLYDNSTRSQLLGRSESFSREKLIGISSCALELSRSILEGRLPEPRILNQNRKAVEELTLAFEPLLVEAGLLTPEDTILTQIQEKSIDLVKRFDLFSVKLATDLSDFLIGEQAVLWAAFVQDVKNFHEIIGKNTDPKIRSSSTFQDFTKIWMLVTEYEQKIKVAAKMCGTRPAPVGVCLVGESNLGKSKSFPVMQHHINNILEERASQDSALRSVLGYPKQWGTWYQNSREEFDQGHKAGDKWVYTDDGFAGTANLDHEKYLAFISTNPIGTKQASLAEKGAPFEAACMVTSCNHIPVSSFTINNINALWNRFPYTIGVRLKKGMKVPSPKAPLDPTFKHLEFHVGPMATHCFKGDRSVCQWQKGMDRDPRCKCQDMSLEEVCALIAEQIIAFHMKYLSEKNFLRSEIEISWGGIIRSNVRNSIDEIQDIFVKDNMIAPFSKHMRDEDFNALGGEWKDDWTDLWKRMLFRRPRERKEYIIQPCTPEMAGSYIRQIAGIRRRLKLSKNSGSEETQEQQQVRLFSEYVNDPSNVITSMEDPRLRVLLNNLYSVPLGIPLRIYLENCGVTNPCQIFDFLRSFAPHKGDKEYADFLIESMHKPLIFKHENQYYMWSFAFHEGTIVIPVSIAHTINWHGWTLFNGYKIYYYNLDVPHQKTERSWSTYVQGGAIFVGMSPYLIDRSLYTWYIGRNLGMLAAQTAFYEASVATRSCWDALQSVFNCSKDIFLYATRAIYGGLKSIFEIYRNLSVKIGNGIYWLVNRICRFFGINISLEELWEKLRPILQGGAAIAALGGLIWIAFGSFLSKTVLFYLQPAAKEGPYSGQPVKVSSRKIVRGAKAKKEIISCSRPVVSSYTYKQGEECQLCALGPLYDLGEHKVLIHPGNTKAYLVTKKEHSDVDPLEDIDIFGENLNMLSELMKITPMTGFVWAESARNPQGKSEHPYIGFCVADADFISWDENNFSLEVRDTVGGKVYQIEMVMSLGTEDIDEFLNWFEDNVPELPNNKRWKFNGYVCESRLVATLSISNTIAQRSEEEVKNPEIPPPKTPKDHIVSCPRCNEKHEHQCTEDDKGCKVKCINPLCQDQAVRSDIVKVKAKTIKEQSDEAAEQLLHSLKKHALVKCYWGCSLVESGVKPVFNEWANTNNGTTSGLGYKNTILSVAHGAKLGDLVPVRYNQELMSEFVCVAKVAKIDYVGDKAYMVILSKKQVDQLFEEVPKNYVAKHFCTLLNTHTMEKEDLLRTLSAYNRVAFMPRDIIMIGTATYLGATTRIIDDKIQDSKSFDVSNFNTRDIISKPGDCGNPYVFYNPKIQHKLCGIHNSGSTQMTGVSLVSQEEIKFLDQIGQELIKQAELSSITEDWSKDHWLKYISEPTKGTHLKNIPQGPEFSYIGGLSYTNTYGPLNENREWKHSPFWGVFDVKKIPSAMNSYDQRIKEEVPKNRIGEPSLGYAQLEQLCCEIPEPQDNILYECFSQYKDYAINLLRGKPLGIKNYSLEEIIDLGLNGIPTSEFVPPIELNKSAGVPWTERAATRKKSSLIDCTPEGKRTISSSELYARIAYKHQEAMKGNRILGFWASKLKDELVKPSKVEKGVNRIFQSSPVEYVIYAKGLFNNFIRFFREKRNEFSHSMAIDPISYDWQEHSQWLAYYNNRVGIDYKNFDKRTSTEISYLAYKFMIDVIDAVDPDEFKTARWVIAHEAIFTYLAEEQTIIRVNRGNKSGDPFTTEKNITANFLYHFYSFSKELGRVDIELFMRETRRKYLGDDADCSVSDEAVELLNYPTLKRNLKQLGQNITLPGDFKDVETDQYFLTPENVTFLKRYYKNVDGIWYAPLEKASIEAPFTWTRNETWEIDIWRELLRSSLQEACLHGREYFQYFNNQIRIAMSRSHFPEDLRSELAPIVTLDYEDFLFKVGIKYGRNSE